MTRRSRARAGAVARHGRRGSGDRDGRRSRGRVRPRRRSAARPTSSSTTSASATRRRSRTCPTSAGRESFQVNLMGTVRASRALVPKMAARGAGVGREHRLGPGQATRARFMDYGACKAGLLYLTKALAKQYAPAVRVNAVLPGPIWSRMWTRPGGIVDQLVAHYGLDGTPRSSGSSRIGRCRWASATRKTWRTRSSSSHRRWRNSLRAPDSTSAARSGGPHV